MSELTSQPNQPDRSDSTAPKQTTTSDARPPWRVEGARGPQEMTGWATSASVPPARDRDTIYPNRTPSPASPTCSASSSCSSA